MFSAISADIMYQSVNLPKILSNSDVLTVLLQKSFRHLNKKQLMETNRGTAVFLKAYLKNDNVDAATFTSWGGCSNGNMTQTDG